MTSTPTAEERCSIQSGYHSDPSQSFSLRAEAYTRDCWFAADIKDIFAKTWQWACHVESVREPGSFITITIAGHSIAVVRDDSGNLRAFYNVCKHRAHQLLDGSGITKRIMCPYHAWTYKLSGAVSYTHLTLPTKRIV